MSRRLMVALAAIAALGLSGSAVAAKKSEIRIVGGTVFKPGKYVKDDQRFKARVTTVRSGGTVKWVDKSRSDEPHTISLVSKLPKSFSDECAECDAYFGKHQASEEGPPAVPVVDEGEAGFDTVGGDSIFVAPKSKGSFTVSAPAGKRLKYLCLIHPWMQGKIKVNK